MINNSESASAPWVKNKIKIRMDLSAVGFFFPACAEVNKFNLRWADVYLESAFENKLHRPQVCLI